eukprot:5125584-Amphidinium_carterae.1
MAKAESDAQLFVETTSSDSNAIKAMEVFEGENICSRKFAKKNHRRYAVAIGRRDGHNEKPVEKEEHIRKLMSEKGWSVRRALKTSEKRFGVCPRCLRKLNYPRPNAEKDWQQKVETSEVADYEGME